MINNTMRIIFFTVISFALVACNNNEAVTDQSNTATIENPAGDPNVPKPEMTFEAEEITLDPITEGEEVTIIYNFTNTGKADLVLTGARGSCGCTSTEYSPKEPLKPGEKGYIRAVFNSSGKPNKNTKTITVSSNAPEREKVLTFNVYVTPKYK